MHRTRPMRANAPDANLTRAFPHRLFFLIAIAALLGVAGMGAPSASAQGALITYFNFNDSNETADLPGIQLTPTITQNALDFSFAPGTAFNIATGDPSLGPNLALRLTNSNNGGGNPKTFQFSVTTLGLANLSLSYATQASVTGYTQTLFYSIDNGATFVSTLLSFTPTTTGFTVASFNLSGITAINNQANVIFQVALTQNGGLKGDFNDFDNIQLTAAPVPEPATVAAGALAGCALLWQQRRRVCNLLTRRKTHRRL